MADQLCVCPVEQWRQNIDCTCTIVSICSISMFACANVWSVCVFTNSICVTFTGVCFAFVNICHKKKKEKKRKDWLTNSLCARLSSGGKILTVRVVKKKKRKEKRLKIEFSFYLESYMYMNKKSRILVCYFLVSCHSRVGPVSQTAIFEFLIFACWFIFLFFFHVGTANTT